MKIWKWRNRFEYANVFEWMKRIILLVGDFLFLVLQCFLWYDEKRQKGTMSKGENIENENIERDIFKWWCGCKSEVENREDLYFDLLAFSSLLAFDICTVSIFDIFIFDISPFDIFSFLSFPIHSSSFGLLSSENVDETHWNHFSLKRKEEKSKYLRQIYFLRRLEQTGSHCLNLI